jgi:alkylhydroperoxidase family enzyme
VLRKNGFTAEEQAAAIRDFRTAALEPAEKAMMGYAEKISKDASSIQMDEIEELRRYGFSDEAILDIALAASARNFFSKFLDAVGAEPDEIYQGLEEEILQAIEERVKDR